ncbi:thiamine pyrophosphate-dependent enzyme [Methylomarinum sp. Ch1-1]|uniref:Thiamine pyrophosphate-dependent enzyme n=1 Tax=Methylomarinum roseum TaxID=3067653 RepID=A0AAU7NSS6_9GAMM|nr:thiamine pyrophosphate-dependent enzyme [Methylomarinum sp. Ch1-1]MDP4519977.1 thiamine pyrophosphate-dependent enzyme [Methylomarinum sp. Ch1-1]
MSETIYRRMKDLPSTHLLGAGTATCAGCGGLQALHQIYDVFGDKTVFINAAGCMTLLSVYPFTPFSGSWLYTAMGSAPAGAQGVRDALDILQAKKRMPASEDLTAVVLSGDGSAYGMGVSSTSGAIDRNLDFLYICYDNEGYGNTGQQFSCATPHGAKTATSTGASGYPGFKKDLFSLWVANKPAYVATVIGSEPLDLARKVEKAKKIKGPRLLIALAPCPTGWGFDPEQSSEIGKLAVKTGIWPLKEYSDGQVVHSKIPKNRLPVEDYLQRQGRFAHLFKPQRNEALLQGIQRRIDDYWRDIDGT